MTRFLTLLRDAGLFLWKSIAAVVALALIIVALAIGYDAGRRESKPTQASTASTTPVGPSTPAARPAPDVQKQWYTCAMHPTVRMPNPDDKCPICHMDLIPVPTDADADLGPRQIRMSEGAVKLAEIQTAPVTRYFPVAETRMVGRIDYDETRLATIAAYFPGRIEHLYVDYTGVAVKQGDHLAEIYSPDLLTAQADLKQAAQAADPNRTSSEIVRRSAQVTLDAVRGKLRLWGLTPEQIAGIESTNDLIERLTLFAPISGIVTKRMVVEGRYVNTGDELFELADLSKVWVMLDAYESQLPFIHYGQSVEFTTDAFPGETFYGRISFIEPTLTMMSRSVGVRVIVDNPDGRLKPGVYVRAVARGRVGQSGVLPATDLDGKWISPMHPEIVKDGPGVCDICGMPLVRYEESPFYVPVTNEQPPLVIPATAALITGTRAVVYVRVPDQDKPTFEGRDVVLGPRAGSDYVVRSGLAEGEQIVVNGAFRIDSTLQIANKPSMMRPESVGSAGSASSSAPVALPEAFRHGVDALVDAYLGVQQSLAADDFAAVQSAGKAVREALLKVDHAGLNDELMGKWMHALQTLKVDSVQLDTAPDIADARARFEIWSTAMIDIISHYGLGAGQPVLQMHCPMAFESKGADWLQRGDDLRNPYFGEAMLNCGTFVAEFAPTAHAHSATQEGQP